MNMVNRTTAFVMDKGVLNDSRLSWEAKGVYAYLVANTDESGCFDTQWMKMKGPRSTLDIILELKEFGYISDLEE